MIKVIKFQILLTVLSFNSQYIPIETLVLQLLLYYYEQHRLSLYQNIIHFCLNHTGTYISD